MRDSASVRIVVGEPGNFPPVAQITSPRDGQSFPSDQPVLLAGFGSDPEDGSLPASEGGWSSSRDGPFGSGINLSRLLSPGDHIITLTVTDSRGATGATSVTISVFMANSGPGSISGRVTGNGFGVGGATLILSGATSATTPSHGNGFYSFTGLAAASTRYGYKPNSTSASRPTRRR